jgi:hypothetical protein
MAVPHASMASPVGRASFGGMCDLARAFACGRPSIPPVDSSQSGGRFASARSGLGVSRGSQSRHSVHWGVGSASSADRSGSPAAHRAAIRGWSEGCRCRSTRRGLTKSGPDSATGGVRRSWTAVPTLPAIGDQILRPSGHGVREGFGLWEQPGRSAPDLRCTRRRLGARMKPGLR